MAKRRRFKGFRWRNIGHDEMQKKERSSIREDDNESEKDEVLNLVAFGEHKDEASTSSESDSESEEGKYDEGQDDDLKEYYKQVCGTLLKLGKVNMVLVKEQRRLEALIEVLQKDLQVEKEETKQACVKPDETQKGKTKSAFMSVMKPVVKMYARTTSYGKIAVKTATATRTASSSATRKIPEVKSVSQRPFIPVCHHFGVVGHIRPKCFRLLREKQHIERVYDMRTHGPTCYSCGVQGHIRRDCSKLIDQRGTSKRGAKEACQEVCRDVRQGVQHGVLQRVAVSNKPKVVHQCTNMKVRQEVLKHGCAAGTRKETDRCINNCVRPSKKQHRMCCWFCGKVGHKKVECFAREKSRNMAKKVNKTFTKPKRVEEVFLAKSGLFDEIKEETSEEGCSSVKSDLEVDQGALSLEPGHEVVCGTKGKEIKVRHEVMRNDLQEGDSEITPRQ
ncbi:hypothetical protein DY000_02058936 [Brassica cretica]|uniref:CCHC-type domain-containing protein n=1 Tax=Brassica cretica TaxID=69181 RepID=A0ABQ7ARC6_BRACR|nr:hypothetical protein DY000_02058936 [Brassica cretica]